MTRPDYRRIALIVVFAISVSAFAMAQTLAEAPPTPSSSFEDTQTGFGEGTLRLSKETLRLVADEDYRKLVYPDQYTLEYVQQNLAQKKLTLALWSIINLQGAQPYTTALIVQNLAQLGISSELYINAFYTYGLADPEVFHFGDGQYYIRDPERFEEKLRYCQIVCSYLDELENQAP